MASGLIALLDDVAAITKLAAASLDDIAGAAGKAATKAAGVVIDDTAVTPRYVVGLSPDRELPIIARIAIGSLRNKLLFLLPAALALSAFAPWAVTPILMLGGAYLCFEGTEKVAEALRGHGPDPEEALAVLDSKALEDEKVGGAIRTDFILSAEIMAIALADISDRSLAMQAIVLAAVGIAITIGVYGVVALIVKMDDIGLHLAQKTLTPVRMIGRGLVKGMPALLALLSTVGTAAMIWVGGSILVHGIEHFGLKTIPQAIHHLSEAAAHGAPVLPGVVGWVVEAALYGVFGLVVGAALVVIVHAVKQQWPGRGVVKSAR